MSLLLLAPVALEARALRRGAPEATLLRVGVGPRRARRAGERVAATPAAGIAVAGFGGALSSELAPGDLVVASELRARDGLVLVECPGAGLLAGMLRRLGLRAHVGPIVSVRGPTFGRRRRALRERSGALAVDMESVWLVVAATGRPSVVVRAVLDAPDAEPWHPFAAARSIQRASRALQAAARALSQWAATIAQREVVLAMPRASCAGIEGALETVERENRQDAVKALASNSELMLVVGSRNSLDSNRLMEVAERYGAEAYLVYDETQIDPAWLSGATRVGITAGASVPEGIVEHIVHALGVLGEVKLSVQTGADETIRFTLPREIRRLLPQKPGG